MSWPTKTLGDVASWGSGGTPKRSEAQHFGEGVPWLSIADLNDGVVTQAKESLTASGVQNSSAKVVPAGTLLVAMYGSIGKLGIAGMDLCTSQAIAFARPDPEIVDTRYLFHFLLAERPQLQGRGRGGTQMNISQGDLKAWPITLPPLDEQRRIAAILDQADALRAKRRQALAHLDDLSPSVFAEMFGRHSWSSILGDLAEVQIGPFGSLLHKSDYVSGGIAVVNPMHIRAGEIEPDLEFSVSEEKAASLARYRLRQGDIVLGRRGEMGRAGVVRQRQVGMLCGTGSLILRPRRCRSIFLHAVVASARMKDHLERNSLGATLPNLNAGIVKSSPAPDPNQDLQQAFETRLMAITRTRSAMLEAAAVDADVFAALQSSAFRGEL